MLFLVSRTFSEVTPESAMEGDTSEDGFVFEAQEMDFRGLVRELSDCSEASCYPCRAQDVGLGTWFSTSWETTDYSTGTERQESVHLVNRDARAVRYWRLAARFAGLVN